MADHRERPLKASLRPGILSLLPIVLFVLAFGLLPAIFLFAGALETAGFGGLAAAFSDPVNRYALRNSFVQGGASAALAVVVGYPMGVFLGRYSWPFRGVVRAALLVPFLLPSVVVAIGVETLFGPGGIISAFGPSTAWLGHGLPAILVVNVLFNAPLVALLAAIGVESAPPGLEDQAATLGASPWARYRDVWGPPSWVGAAAGALLTFVFSALAFAAPLILCGARCYTVEARIWELDQVLLDPVGGALLALGLLLTVVGPTLGYGLLLQRLHAVRSSSVGRERPVPWRSPVGMGLAAATLAFLGVVLALLGGVVWRSVAPTGRSVNLDGWSALFSPHVTAVIGVSTAGALTNTLLFAAISSILALLVGLVTGYGIRRLHRASSGVGALVFVPVVISPIVLSFSLANLYRPIFGGESTVWILILLSQTTLALPFALQSLFVPLRQLPSTPREAAETLGARPFAAYLDVELPRLRAGLVTATLFAFALSIGEFTATFFLATPRFTTLPVELFRLQSLRQLAAASALSALLVIVSFATLGAVALGGRRVEL